MTLNPQSLFARKQNLIPLTLVLTLAMSLSAACGKMGGGTNSGSLVKPRQAAAPVNNTSPENQAKSQGTGDLKKTEKGSSAGENLVSDVKSVPNSANAKTDSEMVEGKQALPATLSDALAGLQGLPSGLSALLLLGGPDALRAGKILHQVCSTCLSSEAIASGTAFSTPEASALVLARSLLMLREGRMPADKPNWISSDDGVFLIGWLENQAGVKTYLDKYRATIDEVAAANIAIRTENAVTLEKLAQLKLLLTELKTSEVDPKQRDFETLCKTTVGQTPDFNALSGAEKQACRAAMEALTIVTARVNDLTSQFNVLQASIKTFRLYPME